MAGFDAERSYTVYEDYKGFYVKKQNPDKTWQKAYVQQDHLEAFFDHGKREQIPVDLDQDKYEDEEDLPDDGNYASPERISSKPSNSEGQKEPEQHENFMKLEFDELHLSDLDIGLQTERNEEPEGEEDDITKYNKKGILPKIDTSSHYKPKENDVKIFNEKQKWQTTPKIDFRKDYEPSGGNVDIVNERLKWEASAKVDSKRQNYKPKGGNVDIVDEKVSWNAKPKIAANNTGYKPKVSDVGIVNQRLEWKATPRVDANSDHTPGGGNVEIIQERVKWNAAAKVGSITNHIPGGGHVEIPNEKLKWNAGSRVDAKQKDYTPRGGDVEIVSEKIQWNSQQKIDAHNKDYQPSGGNVVIIDNPLKVHKVSRTESVNPNYERPTGKAEIVNQVLKWDAKPRIDTIKEDYKPGGGDNVHIVDEKLTWDSKPKIEAINSNYTPQVRDVPIFNETPNWAANPKIDSKNQNYTRPERKDFRIHNKKGYDWDQEKPLRKLDSFKNIRWLPVVENVVFDPVKRRWVAAAVTEPAQTEDEGASDKRESGTPTTSERSYDSRKSKSRSHDESDLIDTATETGSTQSSQRSGAETTKRKVKRRQTMPEMSEKMNEFLYNQKQVKGGYGALMRDRRRDVRVPEELQQTMREFKERKGRKEPETVAYSKPEQTDTKVNMRKHKSSDVEVINMDSLYKYSKGK